MGKAEAGKMAYVGSSLLASAGWWVGLGEHSPAYQARCCLRRLSPGCRGCLLVVGSALGAQFDRNVIKRAVQLRRRALALPMGVPLVGASSPFSPRKNSPGLGV